MRRFKEPGDIERAWHLVAEVTGIIFMYAGVFHLYQKVRKWQFPPKTLIQICWHFANKLQFWSLCKGVSVRLYVCGWVFYGNDKALALTFTQSLYVNKTKEQTKLHKNLNTKNWKYVELLINTATRNSGTSRQAVGHLLVCLLYTRTLLLFTARSVDDQVAPQHGPD